MSYFCNLKEKNDAPQLIGILVEPNIKFIAAIEVYVGEKKVKNLVSVCKMMCKKKTPLPTNLRQ